MATQGQNTSQVGSINVGVTADLTGLRSGLKQAEAEAKAAAPKIAAATSIPIAGPYGSKASAFAGAAGAANAAGAGFGLAAMGRQLRSLTQPIRTLISGLTSITSIFLRLSGIVGLVVAGLSALVGIIGSIRDSVSGIDAASQRAAERIKAVREAYTDAVTKMAEQEGLPVLFNPDTLKELEDALSNARNRMQREMEKLGVSSYNELKRLRDALAGPSFKPPSAVAQQLDTVDKLLAALEKVQDQERALVGLQKQRAKLAADISAITEQEVASRLRLSRLQEQARFGAERQAADISRMVTLLEVIARQRR